MTNFTETEQQLISDVKSYALNAHAVTGCTYSGYNYDLHLKSVVQVGYQYLELLVPKDQCTGICACWLHDGIEDCRLNYNDIKAEFGEEIADIVYAVTNELGKNRKERAIKTYPKIKENSIAKWVKICDRISNMKFSYFEGSSMFGKYQKEHQFFYNQLHNANEYGTMWNELQTLSELGKEN